MAPHQRRNALRNRQRQLEHERANAAAAKAPPTLFGMKPRPPTAIFGMAGYKARPARRRPAWEL